MSQPRSLKIPVKDIRFLDGSLAPEQLAIELEKMGFIFTDGPDSSGCREALLPDGWRTNPPDSAAVTPQLTTIHVFDEHEQPRLELVCKLPWGESTEAYFTNVLELSPAQPSPER